MEEIQLWSEKVAADLAKENKPHVISSGITPSGEIHLGHLREVLTAYAIHLALEQRGVRSEFHYVADDFDPLRRVYPFLDEAKYIEHVGKPLCDIPAPDDNGSYADYFLRPFIDSLAKLGMQPRIIRSHERYRAGDFREVIRLAAEGTGKIRDILHRETGKEMAANWTPLNPICGKCGRISGVTVLQVKPADELVQYECECGDRGEASFNGQVKLTWRVDWPARWRVYGVTAEPFGKDHSTKGGSYHTGRIIVKEVFDRQAPYPVPYEWISLKGMGDMSSSKGNVLSLHEVLTVLPPEVLKYFGLKAKPTKSLKFDPATSVLTLMDEYDSPDKPGAAKIAATMAAGGSVQALGVPFRHLVHLWQMCSGDLSSIEKKLKEGGYANIDRQHLEERLGYAKRWLEKFAPESEKFSLQESLPPAANDLQPNQKQALHEIADQIEPDMDAEAVHNLIYAIKDKLALQPADLFTAIYVSLLGKQKGPRAGWLLANLDTDWVIRRFRDV